MNNGKIVYDNIMDAINFTNTHNRIDDIKKENAILCDSLTHSHQQSDKYKEEIEEYKLKISKVAVYLQKAYESTFSFVRNVLKGIEELQNGECKLSDLESYVDWNCPQTINFLKCAELLGIELFKE